jgi:hemoglobin
MNRNVLLWAACCAGLTITACGDDNPDPPPPSAQTLYERLGSEAGITAVINGFVGRVVADPKINGFFLNASVNSRLGPCLIKQVGALTGGPQKYPGAGEPADADGCRNMKDAHTGMGVSNSDFADLAGHLVAELKAKEVTQADIDMIVAALTPLAPDIIEIRTTTRRSICARAANLRCKR